MKSEKRVTTGGILSASGPNQPESEWLSMIRYQLVMAKEQANAPAPLSALSINMMQDAAESLLALAAEHLHAPLKNRPDFLVIFDAVVEKLGDESEIPGHRSAMAALNTARVNFKHHGNAPSDATVRRHLDRVQDFAAALTTEAFGLALDDVSLLLFVRCVEAREHLARAHASWPEDPKEASKELRLAYEILVRDFEQRKAWVSGRSLFNTKPSFMPNSFDLRKEGKVVEKLAEWLESLDSWVRTLSLGVDMRQYAFFDAYMPSATRVLSGEYLLHYREGVEVTDEVFNRCVKFVIDTALAFGADDFDFDYRALRQSLREAQEAAAIGNS